MFADSYTCYSLLPPFAADHLNARPVSVVEKPQPMPLPPVVVDQISVIDFASEMVGFVYFMYMYIAMRNKK